MKIQALLPDARLHLPGAPDILLLDHLRQSAIRFCRDTHVWREELMPLYPIEGVTRYQLAIPEGSEVLSITSALQGSTQQSVRVEINVFGMARLPEKVRNEPITITAVLQPTADADELPERIASDYRQGIVSGAVESLSSMPGKEWSNPAAAGYHWNNYAHHVAQAKIRVAQGHSDQSLRVRMHPFV